MIRAGLGGLFGVATSIVLLISTRAILHIGSDERFALEHSTVYLLMILGAGFGAITGAILHLAASRPTSP
jgi:hypothetical protein